MRAVLAALLLALAGAAFGQSSEIANPDPAVERRLKALAEELRCLVCQNQTIADSNAPLAVDLRNQIRTQIAQGRSDDEIRAYMVERYGDFVLYKPPFHAGTALLWLGPPLLVGMTVEYDTTPEAMADYAVRFREAGATMIGACCGSTPPHLRAMAEALGQT